MYLAEKTYISRNDPRWKEIDTISFLSKNLWNSCIYKINQELKKTGKLKSSYCYLAKLFKTHPDYIRMPRKVSQEVLKQVSDSYSNYFKALKSFKINPSLFKSAPQAPSYKHKIRGRNILTYNNQAFSKRIFEKQNRILLSGTKIFINSKLNYKDIVEIKISPKTNGYAVVALYETKDVAVLTQGQAASLDMGVNNLFALTFEDGQDPLLLSGGPLKSINQFYNKEVARLKGELPLRPEKERKCKNQNVGSSKKIQQLVERRNHKINDFMHKANRILADYLATRNVKILIAGHSPAWKQNVNNGKQNNQNFVCIPFKKFFELLKYKLQQKGISLKLREESYTSKCSFLDLEPIQKQNPYLGIRTKRGLFVSASGNKINADVQGSYNILRKEIPNAFNKSHGIVGGKVIAQSNNLPVVVRPKRIKSFKNKKWQI